MTDPIAEIAPSPASATPVRLPVERANCEQWDMTSDSTGRQYRIYVAKPEWAGDPPPEGFPVIYLNDADFIFNTFADTLLMPAVALEMKPAYLLEIGYGQAWAYALRTRSALPVPTHP